VVHRGDGGRFPHSVSAVAPEDVHRVSVDSKDLVDSQVKHHIFDRL
jgi:hypothetical protein